MSQPNDVTQIREWEWSVPFVATHEAACRLCFGQCSIEPGDVVVREAGHDDEMIHLSHAVESLVSRLHGAKNRANNVEAVARDVLQFCSALSAVDSGWVGAQYFRLQ